MPRLRAVTIPRAGEHAPPQCCASCGHHRKIGAVRDYRGYAVVAGVIMVCALAFLWAAVVVLIGPGAAG